MASDAVTRGLGLEMPVDYLFHGDNWVIEWFKKSNGLKRNLTNAPMLRWQNA